MFLCLLPGSECQVACHNSTELRCNAAVSDYMMPMCSAAGVVRLYLASVGI